MHKINFYRDKNGNEPVAKYITELATKKDAGEPYVKHLDGDIWELRPLRDRIFFVGWVRGSFLLLHYFTKKTQKTPIRELEKAKRKLVDLKERGTEYE